eukprot:EG_transcript_4371
MNAEYFSAGGDPTPRGNLAQPAQHLFPSQHSCCQGSPQSGGLLNEVGVGSGQVGRVRNCLARNWPRVCVFFFGFWKALTQGFWSRNYITAVFGWVFREVLGQAQQLAWPRLRQPLLSSLLHGMDPLGCLRNPRPRVFPYIKQHHGSG